MERTIRWARRGHVRLLERSAGGERNHAWFPIVQGSMFADLRRECAERLVELETQGYALKRLSVGEPRPLSLEMVESTEALLPRARPRYAMGVGKPEELAEYV